ncbi:hypothetical protein BD779DRAFT_298629 [Infundibulicybe gibba]|nr:hypothetical protein BD779DRAFT_298629 [Infundibulicybe gibba]
MSEVKDCAKATAGLLSDTLGRLTNIITQESESAPPCLRYIILGFWLRKVFKGLSGAEVERKNCENIQQQLGLQLIELPDKIFAILRVLGARSVAEFESGPLLVQEVGQLVSVPDAEEIFRETLNLSHYELTTSDEWFIYRPFRQMYKSLYRWLLAHHQPKALHPAYAQVHQYTWAWAWDTYASQYPFDDFGVDFVHNVDLVYGCLQLILLEFGQPIDPISPIWRRLERASDVLADVSSQHQPHFNFLGLIESIDFTSMSRALPDLTATFCPSRRKPRRFT